MKNDIRNLFTLFLYSSIEILKFSQSSSKQHPKRGEYVRRNRMAEVMKLKIQSYQFKIYFKTNAPQEKKTVLCRISTVFWS